MSAGTPGELGRVARVESTRLAWAFVISLVVHFLLWGGYTEGKKAFSWMEIHRPSWLSPLKLFHKKTGSAQTTQRNSGADFQSRRRVPQANTSM